ncbi:hypothetical protein BH23CHL5_BH23CHL5_04920 [soil metagenome]
MSDQAKNFRIESSDGIVTLTFTRDDRKNALNSATFRDLSVALDSIEADESMDVLILTGTGKAFVAGADINEYIDISVPDYLAFRHLGRGVYDRIESSRKPVIAASTGMHSAADLSSFSSPILLSPPDLRHWECPSQKLACCRAAAEHSVSLDSSEETKQRNS